LTNSSAWQASRRERNLPAAPCRFFGARVLVLLHQRLERRREELMSPAGSARARNQFLDQIERIRSNKALDLRIDGHRRLQFSGKCRGKRASHSGR
jgi:hypothetical protein